MRKALLFTLFMTSLVFSAFAQLTQTATQSTLPVLSSKKAQLHSQSNYDIQPFNGSAFMQQRLAQQDASFANNLQSYLQAIPSLSQMNTTGGNENSPEGFAPILTIPVVVHVIHDPADPVGVGSNLSINQIQSQIDRLNAVFRKQNSNLLNAPLAYQGLAADAEIEFCLVNVNPSSSATNGIDRQAYATSSIVDLNYIENTIKPATSWDPTKYLNLWTVSIPNTNLFGGFQSYAYFPLANMAGVFALDGVVVDYRFFGTNGNAQGNGVACVKEVARYLGLPDIWGGYTAQGLPIGCGSDDGLTDTPNQEGPTGLTNPTCPTTIPQSCGTNDMYSNFMDYMKDQSCQSMFTNEQITVMRAVLTGLAGSVGYGDRSSLLASSAVVCTQPCTIALSTSSTPESCGSLADGTASVSASGGTPQYQYAWSTNPIQFSATATGLSEGVYQVTVTDFVGCSQIESVTVSGASNISGTITTTNETCADNDGTATITPTGGTGPYVVTWGTSPIPQVGNTAVGLTTGVYGVNVTDALGCSYNDVVIIYDYCNVECQSVANASFAAGTPTVYTNPYNGGLISGTNGFNDLAKAEYYDYKGTHTHVVGAFMAFIYATPNAPTSGVEVVVWDGAGGVPGAELGSQYVDMQTISANVAILAGTDVVFDTPVPVNNEYFLGFKIPDPSTGDTIVMITSSIGDIAEGSAWEQWSDGSWHSYKSSWGVDMVHAISPTMGTPPKASFTSTNVTACDSQSVSFSNLSVNGDQFVWTLLGADTINPISASPSVTYYLPGTYDAALVAINGCLTDTLVATGAVTINSCPTTCDLYATLTSTSVSCNGGNDGSVTVVPNGGTGPYNIVWSTNAGSTTVNNLVAGTYTVTVTDATGCSVVGTVGVGQPDALVLSSSTTDETCANNDGSAIVTATGGTKDYTYSWNTSPIQTGDTAVGLAGGTYTVTVTDDNGCTAVTSATVTDACTGCSMTLTSAYTAPTCNGDADATISVTPALGTYPYAYTWSNGTPSTDSSAGGLTAGVYVVTVTDALNCVDSTTIVIQQPDALEIFLTATAESCAGNDAVAIASASGGTAPYGLGWLTTPIQTTPQIIGLSAGTYTGAVVDLNGCTAIDSIVVIDGCPCGDTVMVSSTPESCAGNDGTVTVVATGGMFTYQWSSDPSHTNATVTGLPFGTYRVTVTNTAGCSSTATVDVNDGCNCGMVLTPTSTGESCTIGGDGTATVDVSGLGQAPYTYVWNSTPVQTTKTAIGLSQGTYSVTVTDGTGCSQSTTIDVEGTIGVMADVINASCSIDNGSVAAVVTGGNGTYSYLWDLGANGASIEPSISGLAAGNYPVTVTDGNGCSATATATVVQNGTFSVNVNGVNNFCSFAGASATAVAVGGGTAPYAFSWGAPISGLTDANVNYLPTGIYNVTVTDVNGCTASNSVTVTSVDAGPTLSVSQINISCFGANDGSIDLTINANTAVTINWSNSVNSEDIANLSPDDYTVNVYDLNGCIASTTVTISEPDQMIITGSSTPTSTNDGTASANVSGGTPPYTYNWTNGETTQTITGLISGSYNVTVTDANGCTTTGVVAVQQFTGTIDLETLTTFDLSPNPTTGYFTIDLEFLGQERAEISIMNTIGQKVWEQTVEGSEFRMPIDLTKQASGIYFVTVTTEKGRAVKRVVIAK